MKVTTHKVLVTGASGFVASHIVKLLLERNYQVRGTVLPSSSKDGYKFLYQLAPDRNRHLEIIEADLLQSDHWPSAVEGIDYIMHVASPCPLSLPINEDKLIVPAVQGTTNVLQAAANKTVKKVVLTSSVFAVYYGRNEEFTGPEHWSVEDRCIAYAKSKTRAEKAAWDIWRNNSRKFDLTAINPGFIFGPMYGTSGGFSEQFIKFFLSGMLLAVPRFMLPIVDVRDIAECHVRALECPNSNGKRFICASDSLWMEDIISILKSEFGQYGYSVPKTTFGDLPVKFAALFDRRLKNLVPEVNKERRIDASMSIQELGITYRSPKESIADMAHSLIDIGVITDKRGRSK